MSTQRIERTSIWKDTLALKPSDEYHTERERLRSAFLSFRKNAAVLVSKIATALPGLTQHDITHLDALWETASLITGDGFELTPLEGFVLGGAFLLHDSALCFEAYKDGKDGLRNTVQWKDAFEALKDSNSTSSIADLQDQADFSALRNLHAYQAEKLLEFRWKDESTGNDFYLLENQELRNHLGKLIGQIASSHHWDIETVVSRFSSQVGAPASYQREWRIDPLKIACILRCADAAHLDNERAPDILHVLLKRSGVSLDHWKAQNRLAKVDIDQSDPNKSTLLFTSSIDFKESDFNAWFVAYDAIYLADQEIKSCNTVLEKHGRQKFKVQKVRGIDSPESLSTFVKADGWEPRSTKVHVGNVERMIRTLGGEMLYGASSDILGVVLREMIQNARDSIKARAVFDTYFEGNILINVEKEADATWITIEDNGIGMSERVLTGPLLDFGTSFWTSSLVQSELPGLRSSTFKSVGKFGIGFYSVFMIAEQVFIASRNYKSGFQDVCQLKFLNGFSLRPIFSKGAPQSFKSIFSTQLKLKLKPNTLPKDLLIEIQVNKLHATNFKVPFKDYLAALCTGLDVPVSYKDTSDQEVKIHEEILSSTFDQLKWLNKITFADFNPNSKDIKEYISKNISRLKPIIQNEKTLGFAAISTSLEESLGVATVGGLATNVQARSGEYFIGYIDYTPKSAKRETDHFVASEETIKDWAKEQLKELLNMQLSPTEKYFASSSLCRFKTDPIDLANILVTYYDINKNISGQYFNFDQLADFSLKHKFAFLISGMSTTNDHMETNHMIVALEGFLLVRPLNNSSFLSLKRTGGIPENNLSILDCLYRSIIRRGLKPIIEEISDVGKNAFGFTINALVVSSSQ